MANGQHPENLVQRAGLARRGHPITLQALPRMQAMVFPTVHRDHRHMLFDRGDRRHEAVAVEAVGVQLVWGKV
ncbi:hypothetical protein D3C84_1027430 [compost metagenome]